MKVIIKENKTLISVVLISIIFLLSASLILKKNQVYTEKHYVNDRFYSYDDIYYAKQIFNIDDTHKQKTLYSSVKHPLLTVAANKISKVEKVINEDVTFNEHFFLIVCLQIITSIVGIVFLFKILKNIFNLKEHIAVMLSILYLLTNCIIISTLLVESFIYSATLLIMSYYFLSKKNYIISGILGVLIFGITVTNVIIFGIMAIFLIGKDYRGLFKVLVSFLITTIIICLLLWCFEKDYFVILIQNFFNIVQKNADSFIIEKTLITSLKEIFYFILTSGIFYIDITNNNQIGTALNNAISFIPSANLFITLFMCTAVIGVIIGLIKVLKKGYNKNILACVSIVLFNIILHGIIGFGSGESFLYTPHYIFALVLMLAILAKEFERHEKQVMIIIFVIISSQLLINFQSIADIIQVVK